MSQNEGNVGSMTAGLAISYEEAIPKVTEALKLEGFGVLTQIDMKATLKAKIDADFRKYVILGACNPNLANIALNESLDVGLLLPCNVIVYEEGEGSIVSIVDPLQMLDVSERPEFADIANEAQAKLQRVVDSLSV
jgi:uncharacterized protein (DUF302 family)